MSLFDNNMLLFSWFNVTKVTSRNTSNIYLFLTINNLFFFTISFHLFCCTRSLQLLIILQDRIQKHGFDENKAKLTLLELPHPEFPFFSRAVLAHSDNQHLFISEKEAQEISSILLHGSQKSQKKPLVKKDKKQIKEKNKKS